MPSITDLASVPDMIEAQLTLSYSRLTDVIRVIVDQGNSHEDDISEIRERLAKLAQENSSLRAEIEALKQEKGPGEDVTAALEDLKSTLSLLSEKLGANTESIAASDAANKAQVAAAEKRVIEQQVAMKATFDRQAEELVKRVSAAEKLLHPLQAFADLWGAGLEQVLEMGRRTDKQEIEYSLEDRTRYVLSLPSFAKLQEEMEVLRALVQHQAADALMAKTSEAARKSRTSSYVAVVAASTEGTDNSGEMEALTRAVRSLEQDVEAVQQLRLPPLESAVRGLQGCANPEKRISGTEKDLSRLHGQVAQIEDRLNFLLGQTGEVKEGGVDKAHPGLVDLARRVSLLEGTVEGLPHRKDSTPASSSSAARGEAVNADGAAAAVPARPSSRNRGSIPAAGRPPSGRLGSSGVLPALTKESLSSSSTVAENGARSPPTRRASSLLHIANSNDLGQPTVEVLRRQEASQPSVAGEGKRVSVALEPDSGLRRRVVQLEENTAILEMNKADRKELLALEEALRNTIEISQQLREQHHQLPSPQQTLVPNSAYNSPPLLPQRLASASARCSVPDYTANQQRGDSLNRLTSAAAALGRPMFVGSSSSVYLRDGSKLTNVTVSPNQAFQQ
ncbi:hypothetical protein GH5_03675 [Leishmania sp. Ghana 2012 LV757]|uniref:hypothetical protein n=1 Tax=Leishmania sp. Ghana 2012 LV757 TaxID=2803181 RepID=UPI001B749BDD|nr:hypothetical protein GH5_03675 [Leishmania sp. Ghana 2012 LV757]